MEYNDAMMENIKDKIANVSRQLFNTYGYPKVTMRQIAAACDISVGNLTYYYPRKEDLLMLEHDGIMNAFLAKVLEDDEKLSGLCGYFTVETAFLHRILNDPPIARLYAQVINVPSLRTRYCRAHHTLYQLFMENAPDNGSEWIAAVAMCALEFELEDEGIIMGNFEKVMEDIFRVRLLFAGKDPEKFAADILKGISEGIRLSIRLKDVS